MVQAQAHFGLAAATPDGAAVHAERARALVAALAAPEPFWSYPERRRLREGDHVAFGVPRQRPPSGPLGPVKLPPGLL